MCLNLKIAKIKDSLFKMHNFFVLVYLKGFVQKPAKGYFWQN